MARLANPCFAWLPALLLAAPAVAQAPAAAPAQTPAAGPKSLLPDDMVAAPAPAPGVAEPPVELMPGNTGFVPAPPPAAVAEAALPELPEPEQIDPLEALAGPTGQPEALGTMTPATGGYAATLFAASDARFLATLLNRIDQPLASRWMQISLQRALLSSTAAPGGLNAADWVAARGAALAAMGAGTDAHRLISLVAVDRYTPRLYAVAAQASLAAADPIAMCPLSPIARATTDTPFWRLVDAMCLSVLGDEVGATGIFDRLRREGDMSGFDIGLAERIASSTGSGRRGANPEWGDLRGGLTAWRIGLAAAAGLELPDDLLASATPQQRAWYVRLPGAPIARRAAFAADAAATGAISSAEANRIFAAEAGTLDRNAAGNSPGGQLRTANTATSLADRVGALKAVWGRGDEGSATRYGWLVASAPAAARLRPAAGLAAESPDIAAALVAAGITSTAGSWWQATADASADDRARLWAQIVAVSSQIPLENGLFDRWAGTVSEHRAALLAAGLRGLGRGEIGPAPAAVEDEWTRALDAAVAARRSGEAMVLAASALRGRWGEVPPDYLRRIAAAFTALGMAGEARLIVAEAANRG